MRRIFVVGSPRSGTTLVQSILASHPSVWSLPETHFFVRVVAGRRRRLLGLAAGDGASALADVARLAGTTTFGRPRLPTIRAHARAFVSTLDAAALHAGYDTWVEKTPDHLHHVAMIESCVPGARFVHVVRNGADVVASVVAVALEHPELWGGRRSIRHAAAIWTSDVGITARDAHPPNHVVVRYEQLIEDGGSLGGVWKQLGLSEPPVEERKTEAILTADEPWKNSVRQGLFDGRGRRLLSLSPQDREEIAAATAAGQRLLEARWPVS